MGGGFTVHSLMQTILVYDHYFVESNQSYIGSPCILLVLIQHKSPPTFCQVARLYPFIFLPVQRQNTKTLAMRHCTPLDLEADGCTNR